MALGGLSRELHGSANAQAMEMLLEMGEVGNIRSWIARRLEGNERVIGTGHVVNKTDDPGAKFFAPCQRGSENGMSRLTERATKQELNPRLKAVSSPQRKTT
jgi:citrate synthase